MSTCLAWRVHVRGKGLHVYLTDDQCQKTHIPTDAMMVFHGPFCVLVPKSWHESLYICWVLTCMVESSWFFGSCFPRSGSQTVLWWFGTKGSLTYLVICCLFAYPGFLVIISWIKIKHDQERHCYRTRSQTHTVSCIYLIFCGIEGFARMFWGCMNHLLTEFHIVSTLSFLLSVLFPSHAGFFHLSLAFS